MADNPVLKRLIWSGLVTALTAVASIASQRLAAKLWQRFFDEEPPE